MLIQVANFKAGTEEESLERLFRKYGYVESVTIFRHWNTGKLKALVEMHEDDAVLALHEVDGRRWHGHKLRVKKAKSK